MIDDLIATEQAAKHIGEIANTAANVVTEQKVTEAAAQAELQRAMDTLIQRRVEVGDFFIDVGHNRSDRSFMVLREPVVSGDRFGYVILTRDGFKFFSTANDQTEAWMRSVGRPIMKNLGEMTIYSEFDPKKNSIEVIDGSHQQFHSLNLQNINDQTAIVNAAKASIAKAQEGPKQTIAKANSTTQAATGVQTVVTSAAIQGK